MGLRSEVEYIPLWDEFRGLGGCFVRLVCFRKDFDLFGPRFTSIDLDVVITGDITPLFDRQGDFIIWQPENSEQRIAAYCGSLWTLTAGSHPEVYETFIPNHHKINPHSNKYVGGSDQMQISRMIPNAATYGMQDGVYNFVPDIQRTGSALPENARMVFFNGKFMPDDYQIARRFPWVPQHYPLAGQRQSVWVPEKKMHISRRILGQQKLTKASRTFKEQLVTIVLYWWGYWPYGTSDGLGVSYVDSMLQQLKRNIPAHAAYRIVLFTDQPKLFSKKDMDVRQLAVPVDLRWNLKKMFMYSNDSELSGPVLCFDLDCIILQSIEPLMVTVSELTDPKLMVTCRAAYNTNEIGGSIVGFKSNRMLTELLWNRLNSDRQRIEHQTKGSERVFYRRQLLPEQVQFWEDILPGAILSYKRDCRRGKVPSPSAIAVRFHGSPRPHEVAAKWTEQWKEKN